MRPCFKVNIENRVGNTGQWQRALLACMRPLEPSPNPHKITTNRPPSISIPLPGASVFLTVTMAGPEPHINGTVHTLSGA